MQTPISKRLWLFSQCYHFGRIKCFSFYTITNLMDWRFVTRNWFQSMLSNFICAIYEKTYQLRNVENFTLFHILFFKLLHLPWWTLKRFVECTVTLNPISRPKAKFVSDFLYIAHFSSIEIGLLLAPTFTSPKDCSRIKDVNIVTFM